MKRLLNVFAVLVLLSTLASCGGDSSDNKIVDRGTHSGSLAQEDGVGSVLSSVSCSQGGSRFELRFSAPASGDNTTVRGPFAKNHIAGSVTDVYVGASKSWGDVMVVRKLANNAGFNITLAMCTFGTLLQPNFNYREMRTNGNGIILYDHATNAVGSVDSSYVYLTREAYTQNNTSYREAVVETIFARL
ncbi:MAG: hypothetical protein ISR65_01435 [Bacteriovoracaceae bacterium]|nr:hypothetical protein [Bacteriovoracaceae bacterium]